MLTFNSSLSYPVGPNPEEAVAADFNHDGKIDIASVSPSGSSVSVLLNDGSGGFGDTVSFPTDSGPGFLAVGDFDDDGHLDLATGNYLSDSVSVLLGRGDGTFEFPVKTETFPRPTSVAVGHFNNDGLLDLVYISDGPDGRGFVEVMLGDGEGGFGARHGREVRNPAGLAVADLNGDSKLDVATTTDIAFGVSVLLGNGDGTLKAGTVFATGGSWPRDVVVGDFTGDEIPDLAATGLGSGWVHVLPGRGDGTFDSGIPSKGGIGNWIAAADFNGDGELDVVTAYWSSENLSILLGRGDGTFNTPIEPWAGDYINGLTVGYFNADNLADVVVTEFEASTVTLMLNDGNWPIQSLPGITINNVTKQEGNAKSTQFTFTVKLSATFDQAVTVNYATANGTAMAGSDYQSKTGTVTFAPGQTSQTIIVVVNGDKQKEANETFFVNLWGAVGGLIAGGQGVGTILDDDGGGSKGKKSSSALAVDMVIDDWMSPHWKKRRR